MYIVQQGETITSTFLQLSIKGSLKESTCLRTFLLIFVKISSRQEVWSVGSAQLGGFN